MSNAKNWSTVVGTLRAYRTATLASSILAFVACSLSAISADTPTPVANPVTSPSGIACTEPVTITADTAFAHPIVDARTLAFISFVKNLPARERSAVRKRAATLPKTEEFDRALASDCSFDEVEYRTSRMVYAAARLWSANEALDIEGATRLAMAALLLKDRLSEANRDAALAVFGTSISDLDARLAQAATPPAPRPGSSPEAEPCTHEIDARAPSPNEPPYPVDARVNNVTGQVTVKVKLDEYGYVESATLYAKNLKPPDAPGADLVTQSIVSAGVTDYEPEFLDCKPVPGTYIFRADYDERPF